MREPPFRYQGGDDIDGFPTVDGVELRWVIQFQLGEEWESITGITYRTREEAEAAVLHIKTTWEADIALRVAPRCA